MLIEKLCLPWKNLSAFKEAYSAGLSLKFASVDTAFARDASSQLLSAIYRYGQIHRGHN
jgi:hypothetical protein